MAELTGAVALIDGAFSGLNIGTCCVIAAIAGDSSGPLLLELAICTNIQRKCNY